MRRSRLLAISDVHLDTWQDHGPEVFERKLKAFLQFLDWVREKSACEHFVILGDLLDVPQPDHSPILPRYADVLLRLWTLCSAGIALHYVPGNHDAGLIGLDVAMATPPLHVVYPGLRLEVGGFDVWLEHGHMLDAWLWAYLQYKTANVAPVPPALAMAHFRNECGPAEPDTPARDFVYQTVYDALQWRPLVDGFRDDEMRLGVSVLGQHLDDTFEDVAEPGERPTNHDIILARLREMDVTVEQLKSGESLPDQILSLFEPLGWRYYSRLPWRRAARCQLRHLRQESPELQAIIMGHIHVPDRFEWQDDGHTCVYGNCGTWSNSLGSFICLDKSGLRAFERQWTDPLPKL